ncbi:TPA: hypothetical protein LSW83_004075 [Serratia marcescens]|nr:hypothetical protein [Serratia marcescens]
MKKHEFELPALEYCSLDRAARLIGSGCETQDLLHWAEIGAINLSKKFNGGGEKFSVIFDSDVSKIANFFMTSIEHNDFHFNLSKYSVIATSDLEGCGSVDDIIGVLTKYSELPRVTGYLYGVWEINDFWIDKKRKDSLVIKKMSPLGDINSLNAIARCPDDNDFSEEGLLISKPNIEKIIGRKLNSLISDGIKGAVNIKNDDEGGSRVIYNRAALIKALIAIHYGADLAEKPRAFFDNKDSEIRKDFESKGITLPSGKTIEGWLSGVDINFS